MEYIQKMKKLPKMKTVSEMKMTLRGFNYRLDIAEKTISEPE